jgi:hypothetical protein
MSTDQVSSLMDAVVRYFECGVGMDAACNLHVGPYNKTYVDSKNQTLVKYGYVPIENIVSPEHIKRQLDTIEENIKNLQQ